VDEHGVACLCDFGLSKIRTHTTTSLDLRGSALSQGTAQWMAPEAMERGIVNKMTDIYSFGMTVYEVRVHPQHF
jgi:serine/threonine protein kinase